jgi:HEAT repeat protein
MKNEGGSNVLFDDKSAKIIKFANKKNSAKLVALLKDHQQDIRFQAIRALAKINDETAINTMIGLLSDPDPAMRKEAILSMGDMDNQTIKSHLQYLIKSETSEDMKQAIQEALKKMPHKMTYTTEE